MRSRSLTGGLVLAVLLSCGVMLVAGPAAQAAPAVPNGWVHHQKAPWSWWTPPHWVDSHGPYDLNISSPTGAKWAKYGFSGDPVFSYLPTPKQNAAHFFSYLRQNYRTGSLNTPGLYSVALRSDRYTSVGSITVHPPTIDGYSNDFRQHVTFSGVRKDGVRIKGEMVMDYVESVYGDGGIESFQVRSAPTTGFSTSITTLRTIQRNIAYTGSLT